MIYVFYNIDTLRATFFFFFFLNSRLTGCWFSFPGDYSWNLLNNSLLQMPDFFDCLFCDGSRITVCFVFLPPKDSSSIELFSILLNEFFVIFNKWKQLPIFSEITGFNAFGYILWKSSGRHIARWMNLKVLIFKCISNWVLQCYHLSAGLFNMGEKSLIWCFSPYLVSEIPHPFSPLFLGFFTPIRHYCEYCDWFQSSFRAVSEQF